jgi:hypothetical protein
MKYKLVILAILCIPFIKIYAVNLDSLLTKSVLINKQLSEKYKINSRELTDEVCFLSRVKILIIKELKDSLFLSNSETLLKELDNLNKYEKTLFAIINSKDSVLDMASAKQAAFLTDSVLNSLEEIDVAIKCKTDSLYSNAIFIKNFPTNREILLKPEKLSKIIPIICWIMILFLAVAIIFWHILKANYNIRFYFLMGSLIVFSAILFRPIIIYHVAGKKVNMPAWEYNTLEGHRLYDLFLKQCKEKKEVQIISETATSALKNYYKAAYTSVNLEHERDIYKNIINIETLLFPPCACPDSSEISRKHKSQNNNTNLNPILFSNNNFSKINPWNEILKNNKIAGIIINQKTFNLRLNYMINDDFKLKEIKENSARIKSPASRMKLDLLLKVKAVL